MSDKVYCYNDLKRMSEEHDYERWKLDNIADFMEERVGAAELWKTLRPALESPEMLEHLLFLAKELDL